MRFHKTKLPIIEHDKVQKIMVKNDNVEKFSTILDR
jgi:hypothetical protein